MLAKGAFGADGAIAVVVEHALVESERHAIVLRAAHAGLHAGFIFIERLDVTMSEVVHAAPIGLLTCHAAQHRVGNGLLERLCHLPIMQLDRPTKCGRGDRLPHGGAEFAALGRR